GREVQNERRLGPQQLSHARVDASACPPCPAARPQRLRDLARPSVAGDAKSAAIHGFEGIEGIARRELYRIEVRSLARGEREDCAVRYTPTTLDGRARRTVAWQVSPEVD